MRGGEPINGHQTKVINECRFSGYTRGNVANISDIVECKE